MRRETTNEDDVQMSDVLCDYCHAEWSGDRPFVEGHRGACICGNCLRVAYGALVNDRAATAPADFMCTLCREGAPDRAALDRADEPGWQSPAYPDACVCRRCVKRAAGVLHKDPDYAWTKPVA
jgi:hypothetical protein